METKRQMGNLLKRINDVEHALMKGNEIHTVFDEYAKKFGDLVLSASFNIFDRTWK